MRLRRSTWLACTMLMLAAPPLAAECLDPCAISTLRPGALSSHLPVDGLIEGAPASSLEVIAEPRFGTLSGTDYLPGPYFWRAGADRIRWRDPSTGQEATVVVRAADMRFIGVTEEDFEQSPVIDQLQLLWIDLSALGSAMLTPNALQGEWSLALDLSTAGTNQEIFEGTSTGHGHMGVDVVINSEAPGDPFQQTTFEVALIDIAGYAGVKLRREGELTEVRAWAGPSLGCAGSCETLPYLLSSGKTYHLTFSLGRHDLEDPTSEWSLTLAIDAADGSWSAADQLDGLSAPGSPYNPSIIGVLWGVPSGKLVIDDASSWNSLLEALPGLRTEDFENSWSPGWSTQGAVGIMSSGSGFGGTGTPGGSGVVSFKNPSAGSTAAWIDSGPSGSKKATAHAQVDVSHLTLPPGSAFRVLSGSSSSGAPVFLVVLKVQQDGSVEAQARLRRPNGSYANSAWAPLDDGINDIEVAWSANDDDSATVSLWVGDKYREIELAGAGLGMTVEEIVVGAKALVLGRPTANGGFLRIDDVLLTY